MKGVSAVSDGKKARANRPKLKGKIVEQMSNSPLQQQKFMRAIRREMGWPADRPANNCLAFCAGSPIDFEVGNELARIGQLVGKDLIYSAWTSIHAKEPVSLALVYRELLTVDILNDVIPYSVDANQPIVLVNERGDEFFMADRRGSLVRLPGTPTCLQQGRRRAMKRIRVTAARLGNELLTTNRRVTRGAEWIEPEAPILPITRFG
ncbi:hypothetical protein SPAN111604_14375 [Sphingomonas antarctica]|uniref:hypothetical protein n=1 Tax=Sphingomonas antarctica TaxID=2040274 RepID=UPI0039EA5D43